MGVLEYFRDFLTSMIDINLEPDFLPIFNMKMKLALKVLLEVMEHDQLQEKILSNRGSTNDYEQALSYIWKIFLTICQQNLILDTKRQQSTAEVPMSVLPPDYGHITEDTLPNQLLMVFCLSQLASVNCRVIKADSVKWIPESQVEGNHLSQLLELAERSKELGSSESVKKKAE